MTSVVFVSVTGAILVLSAGKRGEAVESVDDPCDEGIAYSTPTHDMLKSVRTYAVSHAAARITSSSAIQVKILRKATKK